VPPVAQVEQAEQLAGVGLHQRGEPRLLHVVDPVRAVLAPTAGAGLGNEVVAAAEQHDVGPGDALKVLVGAYLQREGLSGLPTSYVGAADPHLWPFPKLPSSVLLSRSGVVQRVQYGPLGEWVKSAGR